MKRFRQIWILAVEHKDGVNEIIGAYTDREKATGMLEYAINNFEPDSTYWLQETVLE